MSPCKRRPDEQAALRCRPVCATAEMFLQRREHGVAAAAIEQLQLLQVLAPVALGEVGRHEQLRYRRRAQIGALLAEIELFKHWPWGHRPAQAQAGGEDLGEGAQVDDIVRRPSMPSA